MATIHLNQLPTHLLAKCQGSSAQRKMDWQTSTFHLRNLSIIHVPMEVSAGFNRPPAHLCLTNRIVQHAQGHSDHFEDVPWPQLKGVRAHVHVCVCLNYVWKLNKSLQSPSPHRFWVEVATVWYKHVTPPPYIYHCRLWRFFDNNPLSFTCINHTVRS